MPDLKTPDSGAPVGARSVGWSAGGWLVGWSVGRLVGWLDGFRLRLVQGRLTAALPENERPRYGDANDAAAGDDYRRR